MTVVVERPLVSVSSDHLPAGERAVHPVGGASVQPRAFEVDLDSSGPEHPVVQLVGDGGDPRDAPLTWSVGKNETEQILLTVRSRTPRLYRWTARIPVIVDGARRYLDVDDHGEPFLFAGGELADWKSWNGNSWC